MRKMNSVVFGILVLLEAGGALAPRLGWAQPSDFSKENLKLIDRNGNPLDSSLRRTEPVQMYLKNESGAVLINPFTHQPRIVILLPQDPLGHSKRWRWREPTFILAEDWDAFVKDSITSFNRDADLLKTLSDDMGEAFGAVLQQAKPWTSGYWKNVGTGFKNMWIWAGSKLLPGSLMGSKEPTYGQYTPISDILGPKEEQRHALLDGLSDQALQMEQMGIVRPGILSQILGDARAHHGIKLAEEESRQISATVATVALTSALLAPPVLSLVVKLVPSLAPVAAPGAGVVMAVAGHGVVLAASATQLASGTIFLSTLGIAAATGAIRDGSEGALENVAGATPFAMGFSSLPVITPFIRAATVYLLKPTPATLVALKEIVTKLMAAGFAGLAGKSAFSNWLQAEQNERFAEISGKISAESRSVKYFNEKASGLRRAAVADLLLALVPLYYGFIKEHLQTGPNQAEALIDPLTRAEMEKAVTVAARMKTEAAAGLRIKIGNLKAGDLVKFEPQAGQSGVQAQGTVIEVRPNEVLVQYESVDGKGAVFTSSLPVLKSQILDARVGTGLAVVAPPADVTPVPAIQAPGEVVPDEVVSDLLKAIKVGSRIKMTHPEDGAIVEGTVTQVTEGEGANRSYWISKITEPGKKVDIIGKEGNFFLSEAELRAELLGVLSDSDIALLREPGVKTYLPTSDFISRVGEIEKGNWVAVSRNPEQAGSPISPEEISQVIESQDQVIRTGKGNLSLPNALIEGIVTEVSDSKSNGEVLYRVSLFDRKGGGLGTRSGKPYSEIYVTLEDIVFVQKQPLLIECTVPLTPSVVGQPPLGLKKPSVPVSPGVELDAQLGMYRRLSDQLTRIKAGQEESGGLPIEYLEKRVREMKIDLQKVGKLSGETGSSNRE